MKRGRCTAIVAAACAACWAAGRSPANIRLSRSVAYQQPTLPCGRAPCLGAASAPASVLRGAHRAVVWPVTVCAAVRYAEQRLLLRLLDLAAHGPDHGPATSGDRSA